MCYSVERTTFHHDYGEGEIMGVNYDKMFKMMIDKKIRKGELAEQAGISPTTITKMARGESVTTVVLSKICNVLKCNVGDIMDVELDESASADR